MQRKASSPLNIILIDAVKSLNIFVKDWLKVESPQPPWPLRVARIHMQLCVGGRPYDIAV
jgi:hypothetical protein